MDEIKYASSCHLLHRKSQHAFHLRADEEDPALWVNQGHNLGYALDEQTQSFFTCGGKGLDSLALPDVGVDAEYRSTPPVIDRRQADQKIDFSSRLIEVRSLNALFLEQMGVAANVMCEFFQLFSNEFLFRIAIDFEGAFIGI